VAVTLSVGLASAQELRQVHFEDVVNDYSPSTVAGGPYEIRGVWSLELDVLRTGASQFFSGPDDGDVQLRGYQCHCGRSRQSRHQISVTNAAVSYDTSVCPVYSPPTNGGGVPGIH
jgi:hypothetical protein